jgi:signal transduction histidine kinase
MSDLPAWFAPTVVSSLIAGAVAVLTHFSSQRAKRLESRDDMRSEAFDQAKNYYTDVIERQDGELADLRGQIQDALVRVRAAEQSADQARQAVRSLRAELGSRDELISDLRSALARTGPAGPKGDTGDVGPAGPKGDAGTAGHRDW